MIPILSAPSAPYSTLLINAKVAKATPWYLLYLSAAWDVGVDEGVDPAVMAAQCAHETGWGTFTGNVKVEMNNPAGLKVRNPPNTVNPDATENHAWFMVDVSKRPYVGALAQAHHLKLYAGGVVPITTPDPRAPYLWPGSKNWGTAPTVESLGGKWAPSALYGSMVAAKHALLIKKAA